MGRTESDRRQLGLENGNGVVVFDGAHGNEIERNFLFHNREAGVVAGGEAKVAGKSLWDMASAST